MNRSTSHSTNHSTSLPNNHSDIQASIGLVIGCVVFGMGSLIVSHVAVGGFAMAFWRLLVAGVIFIILSQLFKQSFPSLPRTLIFALLSGVFLGFDLALWHESIYAVGPGISTLLNSLQIFFLAGIGYWWFNERQTKLQLLSLVIAIIGVMLIASPEFAHNSKATWGFVAGIISGAMLAGSMTLIRKVQETQKTPIFPLMTLISLGGGLAMLPLMLIFDRGEIMPNTLEEFGWILVYGAVMQCMAWGLIAFSIPRLSLALTGLLLLSEPVAALLIDYFWLDKVINLWQWLGAFLTMFAIYLGSLKTKS